MKYLPKCTSPCDCGNTSNAYHLTAERTMEQDQNSFGAGICFISASVIVTKYFDRYRALASSLSICSLGVSMFVAPVLISHLIYQYGWRGSLLIQAAILAHMMPLALFMTEPRQKEKCYTLNPDNKTAVSLRKEEGIFGVCKSIFDLSMLHNPLFLLYCTSNILTRINSNMLIPHLPTYCMTQGLSFKEAAIVASVAGGCCVASRFLASIMSLYSHLNHFFVFGIVMLFNSLSSVLLMHLRGLVGKSLAAAVFGLAFGFDYPFVPVILVQLQGVENLAKALALYNIISMAPVIAAMAPIGGLLYEKTGSYTVSLYMGSVAAFLGALLSILLAYLVHRKVKNSVKTNYNS